MLRQIKVMSSVYDKTPIKLPLIWQPTLDYFNVCNNGSTYKLNNIDERTPPCYTPFITEQYPNIILFQPIHAFVWNNYINII